MDRARERSEAWDTMENRWDGNTSLNSIVGSMQGRVGTYRTYLLSKEGSLIPKVALSLYLDMPALSPAVRLVPTYCPIPTYFQSIKNLA